MGFFSAGFAAPGTPTNRGGPAGSRHAIRRQPLLPFRLSDAELANGLPGTFSQLVAWEIMEPLSADLPTLTCPECGEDMRVVGIERSPESAAVYILTFECVRGHIAATTFPN